MWEAIGFMLFSNLEAFAWCALCMTIFRFKASEYFWQILIVVTLMNLQSFVVRNELSLAYLVPMINVLFFVLLFTTVVRVPLVGALSMTIVGLIGFVLIQTVSAIMIFGSVQAAQDTPESGYVLQTVTAFIVFALSWLLYRFGYGFSYDFNKVRFRFERLTIVALMVIFMIIVTTVLYLNDIWINIPLFGISLLFFLNYAIRKEKDF